MSHSVDEVRTFLQGAETAVIATAAGEELRLRMMHLGFEDDFTIYLATMHGDPKVLQLTHRPSVAVLVNRVPADVTEAEEVEYTGRAMLIRDPAEREQCLAATARTSPIVQALMAQGSAGVLDCIRIVPQLIKYRKFSEIVQGMAPTVIEFPEHRRLVSDWSQLALKLSTWWVGIRPNSLAAVLPAVVLGSALAWWQTGGWQIGWFVLTLLGAVLLQVGGNLLNDYHDHYSGNDTGNRSYIRPFTGGSRVIQLGLLTPLEVLVAGLVASLVAIGLGAYFTLSGRPLVLPLALIGVASGMLYNRLGWNLIRVGLGELTIGVNFGVLITLGAFYVQSGQLSALPVLAALPVSLLIIAVLYINEFQDVEVDRRTGKVTAVVRLGLSRGAALFPLFFLLAYGLVVGMVLTRHAPPATLLALLTLPVAYQAVRLCRRYYGKTIDLAPANGYTALTHLSFGLLQALGYLASIGLAYTALLGALFLGFTVYMYRYTERLRLASVGVQKAMAR